MQDSTLELPSHTQWDGMDWKRELKNNIRDIDQLAAALALPADEEEALRKIIDLHPMNIPRYYLNLIDPKDPNDPIRNLAVPQVDELVVAGAMGETTTDPYGDEKHSKGNGILHKYAYTALVVATEACTMYCRHCFRKVMVGLPNDKTVENFQQAAKYIADHPEITNVVMSGGDPLLLPTGHLRRMLDALKEIPHLNYVRIGSRTPVVFPMRFFEDELLDLFRDFNRHKALYLPTHFNHPAEITPESTEAVRRIRETGVTVNNQAVLLKGVNDDVDTITELMDGLVRIGVNPYYLYQCMPVARVRHHFQTSLKESVDMVDAARRRMDGYAKRFKFIIGHDIGKLEICGRIDDKLILKQIHARQEEPEDASRMLVYQLNDEAGWLDELEQVTL
ncbi:KamA family radical SAM protein [Magnetococcus sp. PR-3]|uniref:KamA family radical SAM protein n=1 Tax=Magnetococcus sp. PR-3 TaxID=3120355 RepID=UPI002FCE6611